MRVLCLRFPEPPPPSWVEAFLRFTPRIALRPCGMFLEISSTQHLFGGEKNLLLMAATLAEHLAQAPVGAAIADRPPTAQLLAGEKPRTVGAHGRDAETLAGFGIETLPELEGLLPWPGQQAAVVVRLLQSLGLKKLGELRAFTRAQWQERWGDVGISLWKRLQGQDGQEISPWISREPLLGYAYFDDPVSHLPVLRQKLDPALETLFFRLEGQGLFARVVSLTLHCEYSGQRHVLGAEPVTASRDLALFRDLLVRKLEALDLANPVKEFEIAVQDVPEKIQQLDFFEPRDSGEARWQRLISFAAQGEVEMGFVQPQAALFPEQSMTFRAAEPDFFQVRDDVRRLEEAVQVRSVYSKGLSQAPRPSLLLDPPQEMDAVDAARLRKLTAIPAERITGPWWRSQPEEGRDYYYALSPEGRWLWIYRDKATRKTFLQGAFD